MASSLTSIQLKAMILASADRIIANVDALALADRQIGDGDHGLGMERGFAGVKAALGTVDHLSVKEILKLAGDTMIDRMGGASGIVFGLMFRGGARGAPDGDEVSLVEFANYFRRSLNEIMARGGAKPGDKTMIDALEPAVAALERAAACNAGMRLALSQAADAAESGCEASRNMVARFGKSSTMGERSLGFVDAGALSVSLIFRAMSDWAEAELGQIA